MMDYIEMNREERYFCFLLGHALLTSKTFREQFCKRIGLPNGNLEVYPESAWLRDYWKSLDYENGGGVGRWRLSASQKENKREKSRRDGLTRILHIALNGADPNDIEPLLEINEDFFWSKEVSKQGEIVSPGRWSLDKLKLVEAPLPEMLIRLKWAFNAKPDLMLVSGEKFCLIEAKIESSEDEYKCKPFKAKQTNIQKLIGELIAGLSDCYSPVPNIMLSRKVVDDKDISWEEVIDLVEQNCSSLDSFTVEGFIKSPYLRRL